MKVKQKEKELGEIIKGIIETRKKIDKLELKKTKEFYNKKYLSKFSKEELNDLWNDDMIELYYLDQAVEVEDEDEL